MLEKVVLVRGEKDELVMCDDESAIGVGFVLALDVGPKVGAGDSGVSREKDVDRVVDGVPSSNNL